MTDTFKVGDRVDHDAFGPGEVTYGPLAGAFASTHYAVKFERCEEERQVRSTYLTALHAFAVGDTVTYEYGSGGKLVAGPFRSEYHDEPIWVVEKANGTHLTPSQNALTKVEADTFTHDGVTYDLSAQYRDNDGDVWSFTGRRNAVGVPRVTMTDNIENPDTVTDIEAYWGPLTRV